MEERATQQQQEINALRNELGVLRNSTEQLRRNYEDERRARQELQQLRANKAQLIALVEKQAQKYASMDIDIDEVLRDSGTPWRKGVLFIPSWRTASRAGCRSARFLFFSSLFFFFFFSIFLCFFSLFLVPFPVTTLDKRRREIDELKELLDRNDRENDLVVSKLKQENKRLVSQVHPYPPPPQDSPPFCFLLSPP